MHTYRRWTHRDVGALLGGASFCLRVVRCSWGGGRLQFEVCEGSWFVYDVSRLSWSVFVRHVWVLVWTAGNCKLAESDLASSM